MAAPVFRTAAWREMAAPTGGCDVIGRRRATMLEALDGGGLLLIRDNAESEGRSLLRALVSEAVAREEPVLVLLLELPRDRFLQGLSPHVRERLHFRDVFGDPRGWLCRDPSPSPGGLLGAVLGSLPSPPPLLVLDSLSWALLRAPLPHLGLGALLGAGPRAEPPARVVALLHQDLHPPAVLAALGGLCRAQLILGGPPETPGAPRSLRLLRDPRKRGGPLQETLTLLPDGSLGGPPPRGPSPTRGEPQNPPNPPKNPLTFRLGLSGRERGARAELTPPYLHRPSPPSPPPEDPEDPDEDLEL